MKEPGAQRRVEGQQELIALRDLIDRHLPLQEQAVEPGNNLYALLVGAPQENLVRIRAAVSAVLANKMPISEDILRHVRALKAELKAALARNPQEEVPPQETPQAKGEVSGKVLEGIMPTLIALEGGIFSPKDREDWGEWIAKMHKAKKLIDELAMLDAHTPAVEEPPRKPKPTRKQKGKPSERDRLIEELDELLGRSRNKRETTSAETLRRDCLRAAALKLGALIHRELILKTEGEPALVKALMKIAKILQAVNGHTPTALSSAHVKILLENKNATDNQKWRRSLDQGLVTVSGVKGICVGFTGLKIKVIAKGDGLGPLFIYTLPSAFMPQDWEGLRIAMSEDLQRLDCHSTEAKTLMGKLAEYLTTPILLRNPDENSPSILKAMDLLMEYKWVEELSSTERFLIAMLERAGAEVLVKNDLLEPETRVLLNGARTGERSVTTVGGGKHLPRHYVIKGPGGEPLADNLRIGADQYRRLTTVVRSFGSHF